MIDFSDTPRAARVFYWFLEISKIPRGSGNTAPIANFLSEFAKERGLEYIRDEFDNVIIKKPAAKGFENRPTVILQGHSDIVAEKTPLCGKDLSREGLDVYRDGDFLRAVGTTLGGDDGIALAYALAILEDESAHHPALEAVFTTDEETGLTGASGLDASTLSGKILINIDSEDEGVFTVGCAGGVRADLTLSANRTAASGNAYKISVSGLLGGHSGVEIDKGRASAIKLLSEVLSSLDEPLIVSVFGGSKDNAIPRSAEAVVLLDVEPDTQISASVIKKYKNAEPSVSINIERTECAEPPFDSSLSKRIVSVLDALPFGVIKMSEDVEGLPETSMNIGILRTTDNGVEIATSLRSSKNAEKEALLSKVKKIADSHNADISIHGDYPGWEYKKDSRVREVMCKTYKDLYGGEAVVTAIHAGLECGIFSDKIEGLDAISIGPDSFDIHTTEEHLSVSSAARVWDFLLEVLKNI